ncbi:MAG: leucyl aminopeptidase [Acidothermus sp.]|nr:leucyl aminopeptidase [Acidothermus sp.]MCL6537669.1 leucyl aminopeptidase [Acidothermus sp.]
MVRLRFVDAPVAQVEADALVVGIVEGPRHRVQIVGDPPLPRSAQLAERFARLGATGRLGERFSLPGPPEVAANLLVGVGLGERPAAGFPAETIRRAAGVAVRDLPARVVALALPRPTDEAHGAAAEGALLGAYRFDRYRSASNARTSGGAPAPEVIVLVGRADRAARDAVRRAEIVCAAVNRARDWVNTPPADLSPARFAASIVEAAADRGLAATVWDERALRREGFGGILGVGQGSASPPRLVRLEYQPPRSRFFLALAGKGVTFDSGGLSLKRSPSMATMKSDMAGAAAVVAATLAVADLRLPVRVVAWAPLAENMPSGRAQRPSDVLRIYGGKTVEVLNTDAEGRLILADALARASEEEPQLLVDLATLTGTQVVALGSRVGAVMGNDERARRLVCEAAQTAGEALWPMPLPRELRKGLESRIADIANMGEPLGGMLTAGVFLSEFVGSRGTGPIPWAHLDIAGPAFNTDAPHGYTPQGGTGFGVRTVVRLVEMLARGAGEALDDGAPGPRRRRTTARG